MPRPSHLRGVFVTGTDTEVGKSVVAASICASLAAHGERVAAFKPVVTGLDDEPSEFGRDHELLASAANSGQAPDDVAPYRFGPPVSPHLAAELAGVTIEPTELVRVARKLAGVTTDPAEPVRVARKLAGVTIETAERVRAARDRAGLTSDSAQSGRGPEAPAAGERSAAVLVCEGVGGLLVPITPGYLVRDLAIDLALPVVIAARPGLGTINHTLLTVEAARAGGLTVAAVAMTPWPEEPTAMERSNRATVERLADVRVLGLPRTTPERLAEAGASLGIEEWL